MRNLRFWLQVILICLAFFVVSTKATSTLAEELANKLHTIDSHVVITSNLNGIDNQGHNPSDTFALNIYPIFKGKQPLGWDAPNHTGGIWANLTWDDPRWTNLTSDNLA